MDISSVLNQGSGGSGIASTLGGLIIGGAQHFEAAGLRAAAEKKLPPPEDPEVRNFYNLIQRKARAIERGVDPVTVMGKKLIRESQATTQGNIVRSSAGDPRKIIEGLRRSSLDTSRAISRLYASTYPSSQYYTSLASQILDKISARKFDLKMSQRAQLLREAAEKQSASNLNISGALGLGS